MLRIELRLAAHKTTVLTIIRHEHKHDDNKYPTGDLNPEPQDTFAPLLKSGLEVLRDIRFRQQGKKY